MTKKYGVDESGNQVAPPKGWQILPEFSEVPVGYREYICTGKNHIICNPIDSIAAKRPKYAKAVGSLIALLVSEDFDISTLKSYKEEVSKLKVWENTEPKSCSAAPTAE